MNIELVVFDLAGTTVDDNKDVHRVLKSALKNFQVNISIEEANEVMGIPKPVAIEKLLRLRDFPDTSPEFIEEIHHLFVNQMMHFYRKDRGVKEKPGVSDTFSKLRKHGIKVGVDTGFDRQITDVLLDRMEWSKNGLLDLSVTSDEVERGRPHPDLIFKAMQIAGVNDSAKVAKVGDTASDLQEGTAAKCGLVVGVTTGAFTREELEKELHTHLIEQVPELLSIIGIS